MNVLGAIVLKENDTIIERNDETIANRLGRNGKCNSNWAGLGNLNKCGEGRVK